MTVVEDSALSDLHELAKSAARRYPLSADSVSLLSLSENATFVVRRETSDELAVLRIYRSGYNTLVEIRSELAWMAALRESTPVRTPALLTALSGTPVIAVHHPAIGSRHCAVFEYLPGVNPSGQDLTACFEMLGQISSHLHNHSAGWHAPVWFCRRRWDIATTIGANPAWGDWRNAPDIDVEGCKLVERACDQIAQSLGRAVPSPDAFGLVHADLRIANVLVRGDELSVIDFDDCGFSWHLWDLSTALTFMEDDPHVGTLVEAWCRGYRTCRSIGPDQWSHIPDLLMLRRVLVLAWLGSHAGSMTEREEGPGYTRATYELCERYLGDPRRLLQ